MFAGVIGLLSLLMAIILGWFTIEVTVQHWYTIVLVIAVILVAYLLVCRALAKAFRGRTVRKATATAPVDLEALYAAQNAKTEAWRAREAELASERATARTAARQSAFNSRFGDLQEDT